MNRIRISTALLLISVLGMAWVPADSGPYHFEKEGIQFVSATWKQAVKRSKEENKLIFLDIYAEWCAPCKKLEKTTFSNQEVGAYFNANFINITIDGESDEGIKLVRKYNIYAYPSLLIIDSNQIVKVITMGFKSPKELVEFGMAVIEEASKK